MITAEQYQQIFERLNERWEDFKISNSDSPMFVGVKDIYEDAVRMCLLYRNERSLNEELKVTMRRLAADNAHLTEELNGRKEEA